MILDHFQGAFKNCFGASWREGSLSMAHMKVIFESKGLYKDSQLYESLMLLSFNVLKTKVQHHRAN